MPTVFIVDEDEAARDAIRRSVDSLKVRVETYALPAEYLDAYDADRPGCLVMDVGAPGMGGLLAHETLKARGLTLPVIMTGFGDVKSAVRAMRQGAVDYLEKPLHHQTLLDLIGRCIQQNAEDRQDAGARREVRLNLAKLTPRERQILDLIMSGKSNKDMARHLNISPKTVEAHRSRVMKKMKAASLAILVQVVATLKGHRR